MMLRANSESRTIVADRERAQRRPAQIEGRLANVLASFSDQLEVLVGALEADPDRRPELVQAGQTCAATPVSWSWIVCSNCCVASIGAHGAPRRGGRPDQVLVEIDRHPFVDRRRTGEGEERGAVAELETRQGRVDVGRPMDRCRLRGDVDTDQLVDGYPQLPNR